MNKATGILIALLMLAGCGSSSSLGSAADRLDRSAHRFYEEVHAFRAPRHATDDAARLAEAARDFNRAVDRSRSRDDVRASFERMAEQYHHVRRLVENRDARYGEVGSAFQPVTDAYLDVDRAMNHAGSDRHR